jgi:hypothetical protein
MLPERSERRPAHPGVRAAQALCNSESWGAHRMTAISTLSQPASRRPGVLGVHSIDHFHLMVPDAAKAAEFYGAFGLDVRSEEGKLHLYTDGSSHPWGS